MGDAGLPFGHGAGDGTVHVEYDGHVAVLTVDRPDSLNAMTNSLDAALWAAFDEIWAHDEVYCVVWRAEGRAFSAGRDVKQLGNRAPGESDYHYIANGLAATERHLVPPKVPVVCAIQGWCIGGAFERALLCDLRIVADDAKFRLPELAHGVIPDSGGTARLFQICGAGLVTDLVLTSRVLTAEEALQHGVVSRVVPREQLDTEAMDSGAGDRAGSAARGSCLAPEPQPARHSAGREVVARRAARADARVQVGRLRRAQAGTRRGARSQLSHHLTAVAPHTPETPGDHPMADVTPDEHELPLIISVDDHVLEPRTSGSASCPRRCATGGREVSPRR